MNALRAVVKWIGRHRALSLFGAVFVFAAAAVGRLLAVRSDGILSEPLVRGPIIQSVYGIGTVTANRSYQIKMGVIASINAIYVKEGDAVRKDQKLVRIDNVLYRAPFAGTVTFLPYKEGENVFTQLPILSLVDLSDRYLVVAFEQQGALQIHPGQRAIMSFDTLRDQNYIGGVQSVYSYNSSFLARVDVSTLPARILPDMVADVAIEIRTKPDALIIPAAALVRGKVWRKRGSEIPRPIEVKTGIADKDLVEIVSGDLKPGDRVLIKRKASL